MEASLDSWVRDEFNTLDLGHGARNKRARQMLDTMVRHPEGTIAHTFADPAARESAYRFVESRAFSWEKMRDACQEACARRCSKHSEVLVVLDGSSFQHTDKALAHGVGPVGSHRAGGRGLKLMAAVAMTTAGVPLGLAAHHLWARADLPVGNHASRPLSDKESRHWTALQHSFEGALARVEAGCKVSYVMDAEADASHVLLRALEQTRLTVRLHYDRNLAALDVADPEHPEIKTLAVLDGSAPQGHLWVSLPRRGKRPARLVCLTLYAEQLTVRLRAQWNKSKIGDVQLGVVRAREECGPAGEEPIEWVLWTSESIDSVDAVARVVRIYAKRFRIEGVFFATKTGLCETERAQLRSFEALARWATLKLSVAVRARALLEASRQFPDVSADREFSREEIDGALLLHRQECRGRHAEGTTPTLEGLVTIIAQLGGYTGKSSGGPPGIKTFSRGMEKVQVAAMILGMQRARPLPPTSCDGSG
jgi:hypothetical protein